MCVKNLHIKWYVTEIRIAIEFSRHYKGTLKVKNNYTAIWFKINFSTSETEKKNLIIEMIQHALHIDLIQVHSGL